MFLKSTNLDHVIYSNEQFTYFLNSNRECKIEGIIIKAIKRTKCIVKI